MFRALLYGCSLVVASWMLFQLVHEGGHVLGTWYGGGRVDRVVWHPLTLSRTDRSDVVRPLPAVAGGVVVGALLPLAAWLALCWTRVARELRFFAGFCLVGNGVYLLAGTEVRFGDAFELRALGIPAWLLLATGLLMAAAGLCLWWDLSWQLGLRPGGRPGRRRTVAVAIGATVVVASALLWGGPG